MTLSKGELIAPPEAEYFQEIESANGPLFSNLAGFSYSLRSLSNDPDNPHSLKTVRLVAESLDEYVLGKESYLLGALQAMRRPTTRELVDAIQSDIKARVLTQVPIEISVFGLETVSADRILFCPREIARRGVMTVVDNVRRYAFKGEVTPYPKVGIRLEAYDYNGDLGVAIKVSDNGGTLTKPVTQSPASKEVAGQIHEFEGQLHAPASASEQDWSVIQEIDFVFW